MKAMIWNGHEFVPEERILNSDECVAALKEVMAEVVELGVENLEAVWVGEDAAVALETKFNILSFDNCHVMPGGGGLIYAYVQTQTRGKVKIAREVKGSVPANTEERIKRLFDACRIDIGGEGMTELTKLLRTMQATSGQEEGEGE